MPKNIIRSIANAFILGGVLFTVCAFAQPPAPFNATALVNLGDSVRYGSYLVCKIGDGIYKLNDPGDKSARLGGLGVDMYLIRGANRAFMVDLGNNYIDGYPMDLIKPRKNAAEELQALVSGLIGKLPLDIGITHAHPDHSGMAGAFTNNKSVTIWLPEGENALKNQQGVELPVSRFAPGKSFDLGGGRVVNTYAVRGHSNGGTVYLLKKDTMLFTGDAIGSGFGQSFGNASALKSVAEDSQKLVEAIKANLSPWERYSLKVFTGHTWQNVYGGFVTRDAETIDLGYLDWQFVQDFALDANQILKGKWLDDGSGLRAVKSTHPEFWSEQSVFMVYGTASIVLPLRTAYAAAGLQIPPEVEKTLPPENQQRFGPPQEGPQKK
jgi:glyoxylase-like metal-dependent hydrolase (beta-lactamase superfamily II)